MAKGKLKRTQPHQESGPRILSHSSRNVSTDTLPPTFSLHYMVLNSKYCLTQCKEHERAAFASRLREMSQLTWIQIKGSHRHGQGCEEIPPKQIIGATLPSAVTPDATLLSFCCIGKAPMVGFRDGQTFHIVTFPRFHRHLYKEECDEIGGRNDHENQTAVHGRV